MSKPSYQHIAQDIEILRSGIEKLGRNRKVALSPHQQWELTDELEKKAEQLIQMLQKQN